jgi:hypothetical protein
VLDIDGCLQSKKGCLNQGESHGLDKWHRDNDKSTENMLPSNLKERDDLENFHISLYESIIVLASLTTFSSDQIINVSIIGRLILLLRGGRTRRHLLCENF